MKIYHINKSGDFTPLKKENSVLVFPSSNKVVDLQSVISFEPFPQADKWFTADSELIYFKLVSEGLETIVLGLDEEGLKSIQDVVILSTSSPAESLMKGISFIGVGVTLSNLKPILFRILGTNESDLINTSSPILGVTGIFLSVIGIFLTISGGYNLLSNRQRSKSSSGNDNDSGMD
jgi:hypothetical protein